MRRKCELSNTQNDNGDWFQDTIEWPPHYLKWLKILEINTGKLIVYLAGVYNFYFII